MPIKDRKRAEKELCKILDSKYGATGLRMIVNFSSQLFASFANIEPELYAKYLDAERRFDNAEWSDSEYDEKIMQSAPERMKEHIGGFDWDSALEMVEVMCELKDTLNTYMESGKIPKSFQPMFRCMQKQCEWDNGDYAEALFDTYHMEMSASVMCTILNLKEKKDELNGGKPYIDYEEIEKALRGDDNKGPFEAIMQLCDAYADLCDTEYERQRYMKEGSTPDNTQTYSEHIKAAQAKLLDAANKLMTIDKSDDWKKYDKLYLDNSLDHIFGLHSDTIVRLIIQPIGEMNGLVQALQNGFGMDETDAFAFLGETDAMLDRRISVLSKQYEHQKAAYENTAAEKEYVPEIAELRREIDELKKKKEQADAEKNKYYDDADLINGLSYQEVSEALEKMISESNKELESKKEAFRKARAAEQEKYEVHKTAMENLISIRKDLDELKKNVWDKKVSTPQEKCAVLDQISEFCQKHRSVQVDIKSNHTFESIFMGNYEKSMPKLREKVESGLDDTLRLPRVKKGYDQMISLYSPKSQFNGIKEFCYDASKLPFNEKEIAVLGMAAAVGAAQKSELWTSDLFTEDGVRSAGKYADAIVAGKQCAKDAMEKYAEGDAEPLAKLLCESMRDIQKYVRSCDSIKERAGYLYTMISTTEKLLSSDADLAEEFHQYNVKEIAMKRADMDELAAIRSVAGERLKLQAQQDEATAAYQLFRENKNAIEEDTVKFENGVFVSTIAEKEEFHKQREKHLHIKEYVMEQMQSTYMAHLKEHADIQRENAPKSIMFIYFASQEGKEKLDSFAAQLGTKYPDIHAPEVSAAVAAEMKQFMFKSMNQYFLDKLKNGNPLPSEKRKMTETYIKNLYKIDLLGKQIKNGGKELSEQEKWADAPENYAAFSNNVRKYVDMMNLSTPNTPNGEDEPPLWKKENIADKLRKNEGFFLEKVAAGANNNGFYENLFDEEFKNSRKPLAPHADNLEQNKLFARGSKEYDDIVTALRAAGAKLAQMDSDYLKHGSYLSRDAAKIEEPILEMMEHYLNRKEQEFEKDHSSAKQKYLKAQQAYDALNAKEKPLNQKDMVKLAELKKDADAKKAAYETEVREHTGENHNSLKRYRAMKAAYEDLKRRYDKDKKLPNCTTEAVNSAKNFDLLVSLPDIVTKAQQELAQVYEKYSKMQGPDAEPDQKEILKPVTEIIVARATMDSVNKQNDSQTRKEFDKLVKKEMKNSTSIQKMIEELGTLETARYGIVEDGYKLLQKVKKIQQEAEKEKQKAAAEQKAEAAVEKKAEAVVEQKAEEVKHGSFAEDLAFMQNNPVFREIETSNPDALKKEGQPKQAAGVPEADKKDVQKAAADQNNQEVKHSLYEQEIDYMKKSPNMMRVHTTNPDEIRPEENKIQEQPKQAAGVPEADKKDVQKAAADQNNQEVKPNLYDEYIKHLDRMPVRFRTPIDEKRKEGQEKQEQTAEVPEADKKDVQKAAAEQKREEVKPTWYEEYIKRLDRMPIHFQTPTLDVERKEGQEKQEQAAQVRNSDADQEVQNNNAGNEADVMPVSQEKHENGPENSNQDAEKNEETPKFFDQDASEMDDDDEFFLLKENRKKSKSVFQKEPQQFFEDVLPAGALPPFEAVTPGEQEKSEFDKRIEKAQSELQDIFKQSAAPTLFELMKPFAEIITANTAKNADGEASEFYKPKEKFDKAVQKMMDSDSLKQLLNTVPVDKLVQEALDGQGKKLLADLAKTKKTAADAEKSKQLRSELQKTPEKGMQKKI